MKSSFSSEFQLIIYFVWAKSHVEDDDKVLHYEQNVSLRQNYSQPFSAITVDSFLLHVILNYTTIKSTIKIIKIDPDEH